MLDQDNPWNVNLAGLVRSSYAGLAGDFSAGSDSYNVRLNDVAQGSGGFVMFETLSTGQVLPGQTVSVAPVVNNIKTAAKDYAPLFVIAGVIFGVLFFFFRKK